MNRLKEIRLQHNMTQQEVADYLSVDRSTVTKWETGKHDPDKDNLLKLAALYSVSTDELLGRCNAPQRDDPSIVYPVLAEDEMDIISKYRTLNSKGKCYVKKQFDFALSIETFREEKTISA